MAALAADFPSIRPLTGLPVVVYPRPRRWKIRNLTRLIYGVSAFSN